MKKEVYIVLTYTGTMLSKIIKFYTKMKYAHVSLSLDKELSKMYSFGRLNAYNPFIGGFVHESITKGTFKRFKNTKAEIYSLKVSEEQYQIIEKNIKKIEKNSKNYSFNIIGLFATGFNLKYKKKHSYYCAEFVKYLLETANLNITLPELIKPSDFQKIDILKLKYRGLLKQYNINNY